MKSLDEKLNDLVIAKDKDDFTNEWAHKFISDVARKVINADGDTTILTDKQVDKLEELWEEYCA